MPSRFNPITHYRASSALEKFDRLTTGKVPYNAKAGVVAELSSNATLRNLAAVGELRDFMLLVVEGRKLRAVGCNDLFEAIGNKVELLNSLLSQKDAERVRSAIIESERKPVGYDPIAKAGYDAPIDDIDAIYGAFTNDASTVLGSMGRVGISRTLLN